jgi:hypothetical protein
MKLRDEKGKIDWDAISEVDDNTPDKDIIEILEGCCNALNHEDELYVPAIEQAMKRMTNRK